MTKPKLKWTALVVTAALGLSACSGDFKADRKPSTQPGKPNSGKQSKPENGGKTNKPNTPAPSQPEAGKTNKPNTPAPSKPEAGKPSTPNTPAPNKPSTPEAGKPSTPNTPAPSKPSTPEAGKPTPPAPSKPSTPEAGKPNTPNTPAPSKPEAGKPSTPNTPAPSKPEAGKPSTPNTPAPSKPSTPEAGKPSTPNTPAPSKPEAGKPSTPSTPAPSKPEAGKPSTPNTPAPSQPEAGKPNTPNTPAPSQPEAGKPNTPSTPAPSKPSTPEAGKPTPPAPSKPEAGKPDNTQPNMSGDDILGKQRQLKRELGTVLENLKAENQAQLAAAFKEITETDRKRRQENYNIVSKNFDKTTPEGKAALETRKRQYLAASKLKRQGELNPIFAKHTKILEEKFKEIDMQLREKERVFTDNLHAKYKKEGLDLSDPKVMERFNAEKDKFFENQTSWRLEKREEVSQQFEKDLRAEQQPIEEAYRKENRETLERMEKEHDPSTAEGQAMLKKARAEIDRGADLALENRKKQKEGELQLELDKKLQQAEAEIRKKVAFTAYTFGAKNENGKSVAAGLTDQSSKNTVRDVNRLVVNGVTIELPQYKDDVYFHNTGSLTVNGNHLSFARYGLAEMKNRDAFLFFQGESTLDMPVKGTAEYRGHALFADVSGEFGAYTLGNSSFSVDFGKKNLKGHLSMRDNRQFQFNAGIKGNRFSGAQDGYQIEGGFFGPEAAELAGGASNAAARKFFAFGAEKQK